MKVELLSDKGNYVQKKYEHLHNEHAIDYLGCFTKKNQALQGNVNAYLITHFLRPHFPCLIHSPKNRLP